MIKLENKTFSLYFKRYEYRKGNLNKEIDIIKLINSTIIGVKRFTLDLEKEMLVYVKGENIIERDISKMIIKELRITPEGVAES